MNSRVAGDRWALRRVMKANVSYSGGSNGTPPSLRARPRERIICCERDGVAEPAGGQLQRGGHVLDLDLRLDLHARLLRALAQLAAHRVVGAEARVEEDQRRVGEALDRHRLAQPLGVGAHVQQLLAHRRLHVEPAVVDRERDEAGLELAVAHRVGHLGGVLADRPHAHCGYCVRKSWSRPASR